MIDCSESYDPQPDSKLRGSASPLNQSPTNTHYSFVNYTPHKPQQIQPSDSLSSLGEGNYSNLKTETFKILNEESQELEQEDILYFGQKFQTQSVTPVNGMYSQNASKTSEPTPVNRTMSTNSATNQTLGKLNGLSLQGRPRTAFSSNKQSPRRTPNEMEIRKSRNTGQIEKSSKDIGSGGIVSKNPTTRKAESVSGLRKNPTDLKLREVSTNIIKEVDAAQERHNDSVNMEEDNVEKNKKPPISQVYDDILKKQLGGNPCGDPKQTGLQKKKTFTARPLSSKIPSLPKQDLKTILPHRDEKTLAIKKPAITAVGEQANMNVKTPTNNRVASARAGPLKVISEKEAANPPVNKVQKKEAVPRPATVVPSSRNNQAQGAGATAASRDPQHLLTNFKYEKVLGQGAYAVVKLAWDKIRGEKVAVKIYDKYMLSDPRRMKNVRREISLLQEMDHCNIIKLLDSFDTPKQIHVVMEFVGKNSLHSYLRSLGPKRLEEAEIKRIFTQICHGVNYCHQKNIVHRDIKLENILMDDQNNIKIIDFGFSICIGSDKKLNIFCGTPSYMAPEIVSKTLYKGAPTDIWALGVILYILLCGHFPFRGSDDRDLFFKIKKGKLEFPPFVNEDPKGLVKKLLKVNPEERLKIDEILQDSWLISP